MPTPAPASPLSAFSWRPRRGRAQPLRHPRRAAAGLAAVALATSLVPVTAVPASAGPPRHDPAPARIVEDLDRGLVAVATEDGTFLSWRLLAAEADGPGAKVGFHVYKDGRRLTKGPLKDSTTFLDTSDRPGTYTVRAVVRGKEQAASKPALTLDQGYLDIPLADAEGYYVHHAWPGDLDGDGQYEFVVSRLSKDRSGSDLLEAYTLAGERLWRVDLGPASLEQLGGNGANDPAPAAISGSTAIGGYRNDDNVTVYDLDSDGKAEVFVHTAAGTTFADGHTVQAPSAADQYVSVIDGVTGVERARSHLPTDFVADGPSGGQFGIAYLDGVHPSLVTKLVTRVGAKRGSFRTLFQTWDLAGGSLNPIWKYVVDPSSGATSFHQIRTVDVDGDGKDDIADGNYVVGSDGSLRYVVDGAGHGDRFDIGDFDPSRPGLEGFAIQQSELGVYSQFPWYYYDAATGERLLTGAHPDNPSSDADLDVGRGNAADIDPRRRGAEFWTSTADVARPGAGVYNVTDGRVSSTTPSVNFRIWWDGDTGAELLDFTWVEKWDPDTESTTRLFEPTGVTPGPRNAVPFYGDVLGDWREEILAETSDNTALRLYSTTAPTGTRLYTPAQNPTYRLGWTVRGYLQSTYPDYYLGYETRKVPAPHVTVAPGA